MAGHWLTQSVGIIVSSKTIQIILDCSRHIAVSPFYSLLLEYI